MEGETHSVFSDQKDLGKFKNRIFNRYALPGRAEAKRFRVFGRRIPAGKE
jgi:hypothetical protein